MSSDASVTRRLNALLGAATAVRGEQDLPAVFEAAAGAVAETIGFRTVIVNIHRPAHGDYEVVTVHGSAAARAELLGTTSTQADWTPLLDPRFERAGAYFVRHDAYDWDDNGPPTYVPAAARAHPGAWHPEDALFAPLLGRDGRLLGVLSVDEPHSGLPPTDDHLALLVSVAAHAALAIEHAQEEAELARHRVALEHLLAVSSELARANDVDAAFQTVCDAIHDALGFGLVGIALSDDPQLPLRRVATAGYREGDADIGAAMSLEEMARLLAADHEHEGLALLRDEVVRGLIGDRPIWPTTPAAGSGSAAWADHTLLVPIYDDEGLLRGGVRAGRPRDGLLPSEARLKALRTFANHAGAALVTAERTRALREERDRAQTYLDVASTMFLVRDREGRVTTINRRACEVLGYAEQDMLGADWFEMAIPPEQREAARERYGRVISGIDPPAESFVRTVVTVRGERRVVRWHATLLRDDQGEICGALTSGRDITEERKGEAEIARLAYHDGLTGLPNRANLEQQLPLALARARRHGRSVALLFVDLDDFKLVNDGFGHTAGDDFLRTVAARLEHVTRDTDLLARQGGDEFLVLLADLDENAEEGAKVVARRIVEAMREPVKIGTAEFSVGASVGVSLYPRDASDGESLLQHADGAMYQAKAAGRGQFAVWRPDAVDPRRRLALTTELRHALDREEFELHYQPIMRLADRSVVGMEALLRWRRGDELVPPGDFIPVAEETGLIEPIGEWVFAAACAFVGAIREELGRSPVCGVNVSPRQLLQPSLPATFERELAAAAVKPWMIGIEVTETAFMRNTETAARTLDALRESGMSIALDDFGAAYSSLSRLRTLPVDTLKIDRSFLRGVPGDPSAARLIQGIVELVRGLGRNVVAEGIETEEQLELIAELGCPYGQGFGLARPEPAAAFLDRLREERAAAARAPEAPPIVLSRSEAAARMEAEAREAAINAISGFGR